MGKKKKYNLRRKSQTKTSREEDATRRVTYLWAASHLMHERTPVLSRFYNRTIKQIGRRINLSLDPVTIKRHVCKRCDALLDTDNGRRRLAPKRQSHLVVTCVQCGAIRRFVNREAKYINEKPTHVEEAQHQIEQHCTDDEKTTAEEKTLSRCVAF